MNKGGKREGAGRPHAPDGHKKRMVSVRLPEYLIQWLSDQTESQAALIESALNKTYSIEREGGMKK